MFLLLAFLIISLFPLFSYSQQSDNDTLELWSILSSINGTWLSPPDSNDNNHYTNGAILGNGEMGMSVCGGRHFLRLNIGKNSNFMPGQSNIAKIIIKAQSGVDVNHSWSMTQNIQYAYVTTNFTMGGYPIQTKCWVSDSLNIAVCEISSNSGNVVPMQILCQTCGIAKNVGTQGDSVAFVSKEYIGSFTHRCSYAVKVLGAKSTINLLDNQTPAINFFIPSNSICRIIIRAENNRNALYSPQDSIINFLRNFTENDITILSKQHISYWKSFWLKAWVDFEDNDLERYWYGHLYCMGCASRGGKQKYCPGLFGPWAGSSNMAWNGDIHNNYNGANPFYGVWSSNHCEISQSYNLAILAWAPEGRRIAKSRDPSHISSNLLSIIPNPCQRGCWTPVGFDNQGKITDNNDWSQPSMGVNVLTPVVSYWKYTQDSVFLADTAYQLIIDQADFWEDILHKLGKINGKYFTWGAAHEGWWGQNSMLDLPSVRYIFTQAIKAATYLGRDAQRIQIWQGILDSLTPYLTENYNGKVCFKPDATHSISGEVNGNAMCTLQWPAWENMIDVSDNKFLEIIRNTASVIGGNWGIRGNDWGNIFTVMARAYYDPDTIIYRIKTTNPLRNNLTVWQNGGGIETCGILESLNSMMLSSHDEIIRIFPNWPKNIKCKFKRLRATGAFLVDAQISSGIISDPVYIYSEKRNICKFINPWPPNNIYVIDNNTIIQTLKNRETYSFLSEPNHIYRITKIAVGINELNSPNIKDNNLFNIRYSLRRLIISNKGEFKISIYSLDGKEVKTFSAKDCFNLLFDKKRFTKNLYLIRCNKQNIIQIQKLLNIQ